MSAAWATALAALLIAMAATPPVRRYSLAHGLVDRPGARRSHRGRVARGGGVAIAAALVPCALLAPVDRGTLLAFAGGALLVALLGWRDDHSPLPVRWRLLAQFALAVAAVAVAGPVPSVSLAETVVEAPWLWTPLAVVALVWMSNLYNFMDGADGLATGQAVFSAGLFTLAFSVHGEQGAAWLAAVLAAASAGFLVWNRPRARIFLGDSGSLMLGWCLGVLALTGTVRGSVPVALSFIVVSPFVVDATLTLAWRVVRGERWYTPHRDHAYQLLIRAGWSHCRLWLAWMALNTVLVAPATILAIANPEFGPLIAAVLGTLLTGGWFVVHFVVAPRHLTT